MKKRKKHWYFITCYECPLCGGGYTVRERRFTRRPKLSKNRHDFDIYYDGCEDYYDYEY